MLLEGQIRYQPYPEAEAQSAPGWVISHGSSGSSAGMHLQVDITPIAPNLDTTIVVRTTGGWYVLAVNSSGKRYYPMVAFWTPPTPQPAAAREGLTVPTTGTLGLGYQVLTPGDLVPSWTPVAVWDDQDVTVFQFGRGLAQGEAPALFTVNERGTRTLVNVTPQGKTYLVAHRMNPVWELTVDETVVRVQQTADYRVVTCPGDTQRCPTTMAPHVKGDL